MDGNCLSEGLIYKVSACAATEKYYCGTCENTFKVHYNNHKCSFRNESREKNTELSKYVWELKEKDINWIIAMKVQKYVCGLQKCDLWICEKVFIARADPNVLLNELDELVSKCRHRNEFTLKCFKDRSDNLYCFVYVIIYLFVFLGINIAEHHLMIRDMKHSIMVICCW